MIDCFFGTNDMSRCCSDWNDKSNNDLIDSVGMKIILHLVFSYNLNKESIFWLIMSMMSKAFLLEQQRDFLTQACLFFKPLCHIQLLCSSDSKFWNSIAASKNRESCNSFIAWLIASRPKLWRPLRVFVPILF
jgi:hypothetical protein